MTRLRVHMAGSAVELNKDIISIGTTFNYDIALGEQLIMIGRVGFKFISLGAWVDHSGYLAASRRHRIKKMVTYHGIRICSLHTPFGKDLDISSPDPTKMRRTVACYKRCIDAAQFLGARVVIFHPTGYKQFDDLASRKGVIVDNIGRLLDYVQDTEVSLAIENDHFPLANQILSYSLEMIPDMKYGFCYDTSHDNLTRHPLKIFKQHGHRLLTTHIADNRGETDDHMLPYEGSFQWSAFCRVFSRIRFRGVPLLEVEMRESAFDSPSEFLQEAFTRGQRLMNVCREK